MYTTQRQIRAAFWELYEDQPGISRNRIGAGDNRDYNTDTRVSFVEFVDSLARSGEISDDLAQRVTL
jgi:hypothetical protein